MLEDRKFCIKHSSHFKNALLILILVRFDTLSDDLLSSCYDFVLNSHFKNVILILIPTKACWNFATFSK
jgi:hypothetical protein